jgi:hypothetical protein
LDFIVTCAKQIYELTKSLLANKLSQPAATN